MSVVPADDFLHPRPVDEPYWNETGWFSFMVPERDLSGWVYLYHRPNAGYIVGGVAVWDTTATENYDCLVYDWGEAYKSKPGDEMFDFSLDNGLTVELLEPLKRVRLEYRGQTAFNAGVSIDLEFTATGEPYAGELATEGMSEWGKGHFDQFGRMRGTLVIDGETIVVDCPAQRDRSWGVRNIVDNPRGEFTWAIGERSSFQVLAVNTLPPAEDPGTDTTEHVVFGYYVRDGEHGAFTPGQGGTIRVTRRDGGGRPLELRIDATDSLGRRLEAVGRVRNNLNWQGYSWLTIFWCLVEWEFDGQTVHGELQDYWPLHHARSFIRRQRQMTDFAAHSLLAEAGDRG